MNQKKRRGYWIAGIAVVILLLGIIIFVRSTSYKHDFQKMGWLEAFDELHSSLVTRYPFTEWKGIDWDALYAETAPAIIEAEENQDVEAYYLALRQYTFAIPDGHVALAGEDFGLIERAIAGGYGFAVIELDDGRIIAHVLLDDGQAARAGMQWGAEILTWDGLPIQQTLNETSTLWASAPQPTSEGKRQKQLLALVRDPVGTEAQITFRNPGSTEEKPVTLTAEDDQLEIIKLSQSPEKKVSALFGPIVETEILPGQVGYIHINSFMPNLVHYQIARTVKKAMEEFIAQGVSGVILDVRNNGGGLDTWVPKVVAHFYREPGFYEYISYYDAESGTFQISDKETLTIDPTEPYFGGPVIVLVNKDTASTAEGIPLCIQRLEQGVVAGIYGTHGSFAIGELGESLYRLPEGIVFNFLAGRSLNEDMEIQVDGDAQGNGGVMPDLRVPLTEDSVYAYYVEGRDIVLEAALEFIQGK